MSSSEQYPSINLMLSALTTMSVSVFQPFMATIQPDSRLRQLWCERVVWSVLAMKMNTEYVDVGDMTGLREVNQSEVKLSRFRSKPHTSTAHFALPHPPSRSHSHSTHLISTTSRSLPTAAHMSRNTSSANVPPGKSADVTMT
jgi:hypothetical protein